MTKKILISALLLLIAISAMVPASGLTVTNALMEMTVAPGEVLRHEIVIGVGDNEDPTEAAAAVVGCGFGLDGARISLDPEEDVSPYSARSFLTVTPERATVKPGEPATFVVTGTVPEDVGSGGRYALVNIVTPPRGESQVGIALGAVIPVRLTIRGSEIIETGEISSLNVSSGGASLIFKNTGNHHFKASAEVALIGAEGGIVASIEAPLMYTSLVPTASWLFDMTFEPEEKLAPGTYTVEASVVHEDGTVLDKKEATFEV